MDATELFTRLGLALGIGLLIGLERGWKAREEAAGGGAAGIRTFALVGLLGGLSGALTQLVGGPVGAGGGILLGLAFLAFAAVFAVFCRDENTAEGQVSATTAVAGMATFALGAYALLGDKTVAAAAAVAATFLLAVREGLHAWLVRITWAELRSGLVLLAMTFVALPLVPDGPVRELGGVNPREIWLVAIALAAVSFLGYAAVRSLGAAPGILIAAAAGGLVSSTAVTITNAERAAAREAAPRLLAAGVMVATAVAMVRTLAIVAALSTPLAWVVAAPLAAAALVSVAFGLILAARGGAAGDGAGPAFRNPFELLPVIGFALFLGVVVVGARLVSEWFGTAGALVAAFITGLGDVDSVAVSMAKLAPATLSAADAGLAVLVAVASNSLSKAAIGAALGRGRFAAWVAGGMLLAVVVGAAAWTVVPLVGAARI